MSITYLPAEVLDLIAEQTHHKSLSNLNLVSTSWRFAGRRYLLRHIHVRYLDLSILLKLLTHDQQLCKLVRELTVGCREDHIMRMDEFVAPINRQRFLELFKSLFNLTTLNIYQVEFTVDDKAEGAGFPLNFSLPSITSLSYSPLEKEDPQLDNLHTVINLAPNLKSLEVEVGYRPRSFKSIQNCPRFDNLSIILRRGTRIELFNPNQPLFPFESLSKLKHFQYLRADSRTSTI